MRVMTPIGAGKPSAFSRLTGQREGRESYNEAAVTLAGMLS